MDFPIFTPIELPIALRALQTIAHADGAMANVAREFLSSVAQLHGAEIDVDSLKPISPSDIPSFIENRAHQKRLVQMALVIAMADGNVTEARERAVRELASALAIDERGLEVIHHVAHGHQVLARIDMVRRVFGGFVREPYENGGIFGVAKFLKPLFVESGEDPDIARRYRALGLLPEGTLGREFWAHCRQRNFAFPGERGGIPERAVFHDFGHVLAGYDTDPEGEIQQGAFQAGFMRNDGFSILMFVIMQFHLGLKITPISPPYKGYFDVKRVLSALARGAACKVDLSDHWDPFALVDLPLDEVRARLGIIPPPSTEPLTPRKLSLASGM